MPVKALPAAVRPAFAIVARRMSGFYDLMLLLDPTAPEERRNAAISETESMIGSGGELVGSYDWGTRRMAYEIDHRPEAEYRLYQFNGDNTLLERLNQRLRITDARAALPHHQGEARPADAAAAGPAGAAPPRRPRAAGHEGGRPRGRGRAGVDEAAPDAGAADAAAVEAPPATRPPPTLRLPEAPPPWRRRRRGPPEVMPSGRRAARVTGSAKDPALFGNFLGAGARRLRTRMYSRSTASQA